MLSPFSWFLDRGPLATGFDLLGAMRVAAITLVAAPLGPWRFGRCELMTRSGGAPANGALPPRPSGQAPPLA